MLRWGDKCSLSLRIIFSFIVMFICMVLILVDPELISPQSTSWTILVLILCTFGIFNGILQFSLYALAGPMPPRYTLALNKGFGLTGVVICSMRAISLLALPPTGEAGDSSLFYSALLYFALSCSIVVVNIIGMIYALNHPFTLYYLDKVSQAKSS